MRRFFYDPGLQDDPGRIVLTGAEAHHLSAVLRMRPGDAAELFDGAGAVISGRLEEVRSGRAVFRVLARSHAPEGCAAPLTLALALLKGQKMELVVQKAAELGVSALRPVISRFCERQAWSEQLLHRWQRIMLESCKQCGRPAPMRIAPPVPLHQLAVPAEGQRLMPWEQEAACAFSAVTLRKDAPVVLLVGPEGGWHPDEVAWAKTAGFRTVSLGQRILRAETAAIAAVVLAQHAAGNLEGFPQAIGGERLS